MEHPKIDWMIWGFRKPPNSPILGRTPPYDIIWILTNDSLELSHFPGGPGDREVIRIWNCDWDDCLMSQLATLWWTNIAMENHHFIAGKIHYFYGHFQLQTVSSPEGIVCCFNFGAMLGVFSVTTCNDQSQHWFRNQAVHPRVMWVKHGNNHPVNWEW